MNSQVIPLQGWSLNYYSFIHSHLHASESRIFWCPVNRPMHRSSPRLSHLHAIESRIFCQVRCTRTPSPVPTTSACVCVVLYVLCSVWLIGCLNDYFALGNGREVYVSRLWMANARFVLGLLTHSLQQYVIDMNGQVIPLQGWSLNYYSFIHKFGLGRTLFLRNSSLGTTPRLVEILWVFILKVLKQ